jgi:hypothetical protein
MSNMSQEQSNPAVTARKWIGDVSAERIGQLWRAEDHEVLLTTMRAADELTLALVTLARREGLDAGLDKSGREDHDGARTETESVGAEAHAHSH